MYANGLSPISTAGRPTTDTAKAASELEVLRMRASNAGERAVALLERLRAVRNGLTGNIPPVAVSTGQSNEAGSLGRLRGELGAVLDILEDCHSVMSELDALVP